MRTFTLSEEQEKNMMSGVRNYPKQITEQLEAVTRFVSLQQD